MAANQYADPARLTGTPVAGTSFDPRSGEERSRSLSIGSGGSVGRAERTKLLEQIKTKDHPALLELARRDFVTIPGESLLSDLLTRTTSEHASVAVVVRPAGRNAREASHPVAGLLTQRTMTDALVAGLELFGD
jgi:hypothetical protein